MVASLVGGTIAAGYEARRAERRFGQVRKLANTFLFDFHDKIRDLPGSTEAREMVVKTALEYLDNLGQEAGGDPRSSWSWRRPTRGSVRYRATRGPPAWVMPRRRCRAIAKHWACCKGWRRETAPTSTSSGHSSGAHYEIGDLQAQAGDTAGGIEAVRQGLRVAETVDARHTGDERDLTSLIKGYELLGDWQLSSRDAAAALDSYRADP